MESEKLQSSRNEKDVMAIVQKCDEHGFLLDKELADPNTDEAKKRFQTENARTVKWKSMMPNLKILMKQGDETLKSRVRKGIPNTMRYEVWPTVCNLKGLKTDSNYFYDELIQKENWVSEEDIKKDVIRTFQDNLYFIRKVGKVV